MRKGTGFLINAGPTMIVLSLLRAGSQSGFDIAQELHFRSKGKLVFQQSTMYSLLNRLQKEGLIQSSWDISDSQNIKRLYSLTEKGQKEAVGQIEAWVEYVGTIGDVIGVKAK
jgi:PadR family transcriptional regulator PadR